MFKWLLLPLLFITLTAPTVFKIPHFGTLILTVVIITVVYLHWTIKVTSKKEITVAKNAILGTLLASFLVQLITNTNFAVSVLGPNGLFYPSLLVSFFLLIFFVIISSHPIKESLAEKIILVVLVAITCNALLALTFGVEFNNSLGVIVLPLTLFFFPGKGKTGGKNELAKIHSIIGIVTLLIIGAALLRHHSQYSLSKQSAVKLNLSDSWKITTSVLERHPIQGIGLGNFEYVANTAKKPANELLRLVVEEGLSGTAIVIVLVIAVFKLVRGRIGGLLRKTSSVENALAGSIATAGLAYALSPAPLETHFVLILFLGVLVSLLTFKKNPELQTYQLKLNTAKQLVLVVASVTLTAITIIFGARALLAEIYYRRGMEIVLKNAGGIGAYNNLQQAVKYNPYLDTYRVGYSRINFALADSLAGLPEQNEHDRANIQQLIQQSIREAKAATTINPQNARNWEHLARIYESLVGSISKAELWAVENYQQAIKRDPLNTQLILDLGGIYFRLENYPQAYEIYTEAVKLNPTNANIHYNLAKVFEKLKNPGKALTQYELVLELVEEGGEEYKQVEEDIATLREAQEPSTD